MYARELATNLHRSLAPDESTTDIDRRFETLRSYGQLPRERAKAAVRLSDQQIANCIMGFVPAPGWAGHVALVMGDLRPVGGAQSSFRGATNLRESIATALSSDEGCSSVVNIAFITDCGSTGDDYRATMTIHSDGIRRRVHFVSKMAVSLLQPGAEARYDDESLRDFFARQFVVGQKFLTRLRRDVEVSRHLDLPLTTDWREYKSEEDRNAFHAKLGARPNSSFLNLHVDAGVAWPMEPTRVRFSGHHFVLFPKTDTNARSISLDLTHEKLSSDEATTLLHRFLSLLSWCDQQHAVLGFGWSGNPVPVPVSRREVGGTVMQNWIFERELPSDDDLLQRLAYYREGHNARHAGLVTFEVLSFFKVFETRVPSRRGQPNPTKEWIKSVSGPALSTLQDDAIARFEADRGDKSVDEYVYDNCRVATAHTSAAFPSDADSSPEIRRLYAAAEIVHALARHFIVAQYGLAETRLSD